MDQIATAQFIAMAHPLRLLIVNLMWRQNEPPLLFSTQKCRVTQSPFLCPQRYAQSLSARATNSAEEQQKLDSTSIRASEPLFKPVQWQIWRHVLGWTSFPQIAMLAPDHPNKPSWWDRADDIFIWTGLYVVLMSPALTALCFLAFLLQFQGSAVILCFIKETVRSPLGCCQLRLHPLLLFCARSPPGYYMQRNNAEKSNVALPQCHNVQCHNREKSNVAGSDGSSWHLEPAGWLLAWNHKHKLLILIWNEAAGWVGRK